MEVDGKCIATRAGKLQSIQGHHVSPYPASTLASFTVTAALLEDHPTHLAEEVARNLTLSCHLQRHLDFCCGILVFAMEIYDLFVPSISNQSPSQDASYELSRSSGHVSHEVSHSAGFR